MKVYYRDEVDMLDLKQFHASKTRFYGVLTDGNKLTNDDLRNWIQIDVINGGKTVYTRRNTDLLQKMLS